MYIMGTDVYVCDYCGRDFDWQEADEEYGSIWECEDCGCNFCTSCFIKRLGSVAYMENVRGDKVRCPECYAKRIAYKEG